MKLKRPVRAQMNQYQTLASHPVITCLWAQLVQHPWLAALVHVVSCKQKALLKLHLVLSPKEKQTHAFCQIDSGAETNIIPNSLYNKLKPTMKLTAYGANGIPNLGSCQVYVKGPDSPYPKSVQAEIVDVYDPAVNRQWLCQHKVWIF